MSLLGETLRTVFSNIFRGSVEIHTNFTPYLLKNLSVQMQCHQSTVVSATIITTPTLISSLLRETSQHEWIFHVHGHTKSVVYLSNPFKRLSQKPYQFQKPDQPHLQYFDLWGYFSCVEARRSSVACKSWRICILRCSIKNR